MVLLEKKEPQLGEDCSTCAIFRVKSISLGDSPLATSISVMFPLFAHFLHFPLQARSHLFRTCAVRSLLSFVAEYLNTGTHIFAAALPLLSLARLALKTTLDILPPLSWEFHATCG
jgi:hypothetical protein